MRAGIERQAARSDFVLGIHAGAEFGGRPDLYESQDIAVDVYFGHAISPERSYVHEISARIEGDAGRLRERRAQRLRIGEDAIVNARIQIERGDLAGSDLNVRNLIIHPVAAQVRLEEGEVQSGRVGHVEIAVNGVHGEAEVDGADVGII